MLELSLAAERLEAVVKVSDDARVLDAYNATSRDIVCGRTSGLALSVLLMS